MKEGSRVLPPQGGIHAGGQRPHGTPGSHVGSAAQTHHPGVPAAAPAPFPAVTGANIGTEAETLPGGEQSIIEAGVEADLSGGSPTVETEVTVDPNADGGLVDAEATTSGDIVEQELTSSTGLEIDNGTNTTAAETTTVGTETGGTTAPATNEVTGEVEADVEGAGAGDDVECNPADGILCPFKL
ncbi:MAG: hypothetical protein HYZ93_04330 [Candidatus Omnitrophica bacterium]|nr:hypothetical protein [Candidatus Omnitrophota bacterium]